MLVSAVQKSESAMFTYIFFFEFLSHLGQYLKNFNNPIMKIKCKTQGRFISMYDKIHYKLKK